ncbi:TonB-dependent receptor domain-containing protein [Sphingopyxis sp. GC21]|uniref:TonB-dependent receptor domain-containing protein n=1 Tax=Sphingopyxis sp. GC21 TaxID=2933562 RepID=UPI0021E46641|nr:TonB-dependent receptor [Sphingopyxis sp. GC21]
MITVRAMRAGLYGGLSALAILAAAAPAAAQDVVPDASADADSSTQIIVTGSRIARTDADTIQPTLVTTSDQIDRRGYTNVAQALSEIAAFGVPGNSNVGAQEGPFGSGQTFVDFFSLGSQRTLTLVNGRRFVSSNTASVFGPAGPGSQVDLNVIPETLVDRIETVAVGGAPIYGSDAIAGTVNIILKRDFDGLEIKGQAGVSQRGDAPDYRISVIWGADFADGRGHITLSGEWNRARGLATGDRFLTSAAGPFFTTAADPASPFQQQLYYDQRLNVFTNSGVPLAFDSIPEFGGIFDASGNVLTFNDAGRLVPLDFGTRTGSLFESSGGNGFATKDYGNLSTNNDRYLATALGSFDLSDTVRWFGEGWYAHSKGTNIAAQPLYNTALAGPGTSPNGNLVLSLDNPYLNDADRATIRDNLAAYGLLGGIPIDADGDGNPDFATAPDSFLMARANTDLTTGRADTTVELYRFVTGLDGELGVGDRIYKWDVSANYGHSKTRGRERVLVQQNFLNAVDAVDEGVFGGGAANGNIICRPGYSNANIATLNATCAPLDLFGVGRFSQAALDYVTTIADPTATNSQFVLSASVNGPLFQLPGGDVIASLGYEHRHEKTAFDPGAYYYGEDVGGGFRMPFGRSIPIDPVRGSFTTNEFSGELKIPVITPGMDSFVNAFELDGAARYIDHSAAGGDWTWTAGGRLSPVADVTIRGNFTRSVRAPAITESFSSTSLAFATANDPCDRRFVNSGPNPAQRRANCIAGGIANPDAFTSNIVGFTAPISVSGNAALKNERADSWTVGAIVRPRFVPGLTITADWVDIRLRDAIILLGAGQTLDACYDAVAYPAAVCRQIDRDPGGQVTFVRTGYANAASMDFRGLTAEIAYRREIAADTALGLSLNYFYLDKLETRVGTGDIDTARGEIGNPKHSFTANVTVDRGPVNLLWQTQYYGKSVWNADAAPNALEYSGVGSWWLFNASLGVDVSKQFSLRLIVDNVFDAKPPFPAPAANGTITYYSGILGRYFRASATAKF